MARIPLTFQESILIEGDFVGMVSVYRTRTDWHWGTITRNKSWLFARCAHFFLSEVAIKTGDIMTKILRLCQFCLRVQTSRAWLGRIPPRWANAPASVVAD